MNEYNQKGIGLIEAVVATALLLGIVLGLLSAYSFFVRTSLDNTNLLQASLLLEEGVEVLRFLRTDDWTGNIVSLSTATTYAFVKNGSLWATGTTPEYIEKFERTFTFSDVYRDANDDIAVSGTLDSEIVRVDMSVSWSDRGATTTKTTEFYLANIFE